MKDIKKKLIAIGGAATIATSCSVNENVTKSNPSADETSDAKQQKTTTSDSTSLVQRLKVLATAQYDTIALPNAMCYSIAAPMEENYVCPKCGAETASTAYANGNIRSIRNVVKDIKSMGYDVLLDESQYCQKCSAKKFENPTLCFKIRFSKNAEYHVAYSNASADYYAVKAFFEGEKSFKTYVSNNRDEAERTLKIVEKMTGLKK